MAVLPLFVMAVAGVFVAVGTGVVRPTPADLFMGLGPAYLMGVAATGIVAIALLVVGLPVVVAFLTAAAIVAVAGAIGARQAHRDAPQGPTPALGLASGVLLALTGIAVLGALVAIGLSLPNWDAWSIYARKAVDLFYDGRLDAGFFTNPALRIMHPDYPLLVPLVEAVQMKFGGAVNGTGAPLLGWSLLIGYAWTVVFVALRVLGKPWAIVVGFAIVLVPGGYQQAFTGYADVPMAAFIGAGTLFIGCWLRTGSVSFLSAGALLLAGAAATKNEGLLGAVVVLVAAVVVSGANLPTRRRHALIALALVAVSVLPWRIWVARHGIHGDVPFLDGLSPSYLADRTGRASLAAGRLARTAVGKDWPVIVPAAIILAGVAVASRQLRPLAAFHAIAGLAFFAVLVWIYWISTSNIHWYLSTSGSRTTTALVFIGASAVVHLSAKPSPDNSPLADEGHTPLAP